MQAVLMAGGEGRRLRPITAVLPKPLVPIGNVSVLEMLLRQLSHQGFDEAVLCVGHKAELVMAAVGDGRRFGLDVRFHREESPRGTVGALTDVADWLDDSFLVMNGDLCTDLDFRQLLERHHANDAPATISAFRREERLELGVLDLTEDGGRLAAFREKPVRDFWVSMGVNALDRSVLDLIPHERPFGFDQLMLAMLESERPVDVFRHEGFWLDIGRPDDYERMLDLLPSVRHRLFPWAEETHGSP